MNLITTNNFNLINQVAWRVLNLLIERKAMLHPAGTVFYVWQRADRIIVAFDPDTIDAKRVNEEFAHALSTRLHGRRVVFTNSRGVFMQVGLEIPTAPRPLETRPLDLSRQPSAWHLPIGMTNNGPLWIPLVSAISILIGGSTGMGKTGEEHAWIQALLHGGRTLVYAWDGKHSVEFIRYADKPNFHLMTNVSQLEGLQALLQQREQQLLQSGSVNILMHNEKHPNDFILPIALFVDEAADLPDSAKALLQQMISIYRFVGLYPIVATNQPKQAEMFDKTNLHTRLAFRVPHHVNSTTILGNKGAEDLPDVCGRGLIHWRGRLIEFQSFQVTLPDVSEEALRLVADSPAAPKPAEDPLIAEIRQLAESIRDQWKPEMSGSAVGRLLGKTYSGSWYQKINRIIAYLSSSTSPATPGVGVENPA